MAAVQAYFRPVLILMTAVENSLLSLGGLLWTQTKDHVQDLYLGLVDRASIVYGDARRRASDAYEDIQVKAGGTCQAVHGRALQVYQNWVININLVYIQSHLRFKLALHRCQFQFSLLCQDMMRRFRIKFHVTSAQTNFMLFRKWSRIKFTKFKKATAKKVKNSLETMSRKASEYEDVLDENLHTLSWSPSTDQLLAQEEFESCGGSSPPLSQAPAVGIDELISPSPPHNNTSHDSSSRSSRPDPDGGSPSSPPGVSSPQTEQPRPPSLPPPIHNDPPPRPPERPPKKPTLRSLFHGPGSDTSQQAGAGTTDQLEKPSLEPDMLRVEDQAAHDSRNASPGRTYFYRKPPAPDPPKSPEATPTTTSSSSPASVGSPSSLVSSPPRPLASPSSHLIPPTSTTSRSSTPDLPPPPPPPMTEEEVMVSDEPLPPPPTPSEVAAPPHTDDTKAPNTPQTYHKDSYMAHRRDWKTGFEGRYRRTISPSSSSRNLLCPRELSSATTSPPPSTTTTGPERRSSTTAAPTTIGIATNTPTATSPSGSRRTFSASQLTHSNSNYPCDDNTTKTNGWQGSGQSPVSSTTVSFTADELKAFKARRAYAQDSVNQPHPSQLLQSSQSSPALSAMPPLSLTPASLPLSSILSGDADSSLAYEQVGSSLSPSRPSPTQSWRASLDSLNQSSPSGAPIATNNKQSPRTITRATSLAETFHSSEECRKSQEVPQLPRSSSINESLSRITAISDSLSRSTSVADSLCRSLSVTETPIYNRSNSVSDASSHLSSLPEAPAVSPTSPMSSVPHDGPVTAHPATVTEEAASPVSSKSSPVHHPSSPETLPSPVAHSPAAVSMPSLTTSTSSPAAASDISNSPAHPVTSPSMSSSMEPVDDSIIVLGYGRTPYQEELDCDRLSQDYVPHFSMDNKLRALLAPGPEHKTAAHYMQGVFNLELRRDLITSTHATHPDVSQSLRSLPLQTNTDHTNGAQTVNERAPLPSDSAYFTSESKGKMLTRLRGSSDALHHNITQHSQLNKKKEELVASIGRKLDILRAEREAIKEEMRLNKELGAEVTSKVEARARLAEADKYKLHVEEIDKITSLLLGLSGRLARAENALFIMVEDADPEEKTILERKRDKLSEQLEEAKRLKENIDRRAIQVSKVLNQYLTEDQYADYDHFIKMKAKLIMDAREIDDKIKLGEEQQQALRETMSKKQ